MKDGIGLELDFSKFKLEKVMKKKSGPLLEKGLFNAGNETIRDADNEQPKTPHKEGHLKATGQVKDLKISKDKTSVTVSYGVASKKGGLGQGGAPYAARWHEVEPGTVKFTEPGAGPKYLESKLVRHAKKYMAIIAESIRRG